MPRNEIRARKSRAVTEFRSEQDEMVSGVRNDIVATARQCGELDTWLHCAV